MKEKTSIKTWMNNATPPSILEFSIFEICQGQNILLEISKCVMSIFGGVSEKRNYFDALTRNVIRSLDVI